MTIVYNNYGTYIMVLYNYAKYIVHNYQRLSQFQGNKPI